MRFYDKDIVAARPNLANPSLLVTAASHHRQNPAPRTSY
jgi:hypothetical protein